MCKFKTLFSAVVLLTAGALSAAQFAVIGRTDKAPVIDGKLNDACYRKSMPLTGFTRAVSLELEKEQTELRFVYDDNYLYGAVYAKQKNIAKLPHLSPLKHKTDCWNYDSVELFFAISPTKMKQFMFGYTGSFGVLDVNMTAQKRYVLNTKTKMKVAAGRTADGWQLEFAIPRNELPKGDLKFHINRNHRGIGHSCWVRMTEINWRDTTKYGTLKLAKCVPAMTFDKLPDMLLKSKLGLTLKAPQKLNIVITASGKKFNFKSTGKPMILPYKVLPNKKSMELQITCPKNGLLYRYEYAIPVEKLSMTPRNLSNGKLPLASGVALDSRIIWISKHNLSGGDQHNGYRYRIDNRLIFEVPAGLKVSSGKKIGEKVVNGRKIHIYEQKYKFAYNAPGWLGTSFLSTLPPGSKGSFRYKLQWANGVQPWSEIKYEVVAVKPAPRPKKFINGFYAFWPRSVADAKKLAAIGINTFTVRGYGNDMIKLSLALQKNGYFVKRAEYFWPGAAHNRGGQDYLRWTRLDRRARARDIHGYYIPNSTGYLISPTYRGKYYNEAIQKEIEFCKKAKITYFPFDMEDYVQRYGERGDFSARTVNMFKKHFTKTWPDKKYIEPQVFERDPKKYPFYHTAWVDFKCAQWADFFIEMKNRFAKGLKGCQSAPVKGILFSEWSAGTPFTEEGRNHMLRDRKFYDAFNVIESSMYSSADRSVRQFAGIIDKFKKHFPDLKLDFITTPSPDSLDDAYYKSTAPDYKDRFKYLMMESMAFGCIGIQTYYYGLAHLHTMRQISEAMNILVKIEDIVLNGKRFKLTTNIPLVTLKDRFHGKMQTWYKQERVFAKGLKYGNKDLITVSEYLSHGKLDVMVNYTPGRKVRLKDVETGKVLGTLNANAKNFRVTIPANRRCIMILAETVK